MKVVLKARTAAAAVAVVAVKAMTDLSAVVPSSQVPNSSYSGIVVVPVSQGLNFSMPATAAAVHADH